MRICGRVLESCIFDASAHSLTKQLFDTHTHTHARTHTNGNTFGLALWTWKQRGEDIRIFTIVGLVSEAEGCSSLTKIKPNNIWWGHYASHKNCSVTKKKNRYVDFCIISALILLKMTCILTIRDLSWNWCCVLFSPILIQVIYHALFRSCFILASFFLQRIYHVLAKYSGWTWQRLLIHNPHATWMSLKKKRINVEEWHLVEYIPLPRANSPFLFNKG